MRSGHYTAYVKVRPSGAHASSNGLAQGRMGSGIRFEPSSSSFRIGPLTPTSPAGDAEAPRGSWFHISDTSVQPVSESKVQGCQAYLLFYERLVWSKATSNYSGNPDTATCCCCCSLPLPPHLHIIGHLKEWTEIGLRQRHNMGSISFCITYISRSLLFFLSCRKLSQIWNLPYGI